MKRFLMILVMALFIYINPLSIRISYAGIFDIFKDPVELCMDRVMDMGEDPYSAARVCNGANKSTKKCMDRVMDMGEDPYSAARACTGKTN